MAELDQAVEMLRDMIPLIIGDDETLCDTLAAAVDGSNGAFTSLTLVHKLVKEGTLPHQKAGIALKVQQRASSGQLTAPGSPRASAAAPSVAALAAPAAAPAVVVASVVPGGSKTPSPEMPAHNLELSNGQLSIVQQALQQLDTPAAAPPSPAAARFSDSPLPPHAQIFGNIPKDPRARDALALDSVESQLRAMREASGQRPAPNGGGLAAPIGATRPAGAPSAMAPPPAAKPANGRAPSLVVAAPARTAGAIDPLLQSWSPSQLASASSTRAFDMSAGSGDLDNSNGRIDVTELMDESMKSMASLLLDDCSFNTKRSDDSRTKAEQLQAALDNTNYSIDMSVSDGTMSQVLAACQQQQAQAQQ